MFVIAQRNDPPPWAFVLFFVVLLVLALLARNRGVEDASRILHIDAAARGLGLFVMLFGSAAAYLIAYAPISEALQRHRTILVHRGAVGVPGVIVFCGLTLLLAGKRSPKLFIVEHGQRLTTLQWGFVGTCVAICLTLEVAFTHYLQIHGYTIR